MLAGKQPFLNSNRSSATSFLCRFFSFFTRTGEERSKNPNHMLESQQFPWMISISKPSLLFPWRFQSIEPLFPLPQLRFQCLFLDGTIGVHLPQVRRQKSRYSSSSSLVNQSLLVSISEIRLISIRIGQSVPVLLPSAFRGKKHLKSIPTWSSSLFFFHRRWYRQDPGPIWYRIQ